MSRRFFSDNKFSVGATIQMDPQHSSDELKHLVRVLRKQVGDTILLTNGQRQEAEAEILSIHKSGASFSIKTVRDIPEPTPGIILLQGILKGPRMDWLVEKLTELEIHALQPIATEFVVAVDATEDTKKRLDRWQRISLSAMKQSGAGSRLEIREALALEQAATAYKNEVRILLSLAPDAKPIGKILEAYCKPSLQKKIVLAIGPEGGFSQAEEKYLLSHGFLAASMGQSTLRGETAALVACALARDWIDFWNR